MATGRSTQLTKQAGEYLVAAELCRRGLMTATFSGNVPEYDLVATDQHGNSVLVQVKAILRGSWQLDVKRFVRVDLDGRRQILGEPLQPPVKDLGCVLVALDRYGTDRFYVLSWSALRDIIILHHGAYLARHGGIRPKRFDSFHTAVTEAQLKPFESGWAALFDNLPGSAVVQTDA